MRNAVVPTLAAFPEGARVSLRPGFPNQASSSGTVCDPAYRRVTEREGDIPVRRRILEGGAEWVERRRFACV